MGAWHDWSTPPRVIGIRRGDTLHRPLKHTDTIMVIETNEDGWITYMDGDDLLERALQGPGMIGLPLPVSSEFVGAIL